jgi:hypothetical protein
MVSPVKAAAHFRAGKPTHTSITGVDFSHSELA